MARSSRTPAPCPCCDAPLVEIRLGADLTLRSCSNCDNRWWLRSEQPAPLDQVLHAVAGAQGRRRPAVATA